MKTPWVILLPKVTPQGMPAFVLISWRLFLPTLPLCVCNARLRYRMRCNGKWIITIVGSNPTSITHHLCDLERVLTFSEPQFSNLRSKNNYAFQSTQENRYSVNMNSSSLPR